MGDKKKNKVEPSDFLKKLHSAVTSGDPKKGFDVIQKINEIHKLADTMDGNTASSKFDKRIEEAGYKKELTPEERKKITLDGEKEKLKREKEEDKYKLMSEISNAEYEINTTEKELEEIREQYKKLIEVQKEELKILKIKYEEKYGEDEK